MDIIVSEADDTDYLVSSKKNREILDQSIIEVENSILVRKNLEELNL